MNPVDALTAPDQGEADATPAAEAVHWLTHPDTPRRSNSLADLISQWESEPEWTGPPEDDRGNDQ